VFARFTEEARRAVVVALEEAAELCHAAIGVEHLLLGVARVAPGLLGEDAQHLRARVVDGHPPELDERPARMSFTPEAHAGLTLADEEVVFQGHTRGGPGHLVLGLLNAAPEAVAPFVRDLDALRARALEHAEIPARPGAEDGVDAALRAGHAVPVLLGDAPTGHLGARQTDARLLLAVLAAGGPAARLLRERGVDEAAVRALLDA